MNIRCLEAEGTRPALEDLLVSVTTRAAPRRTGLRRLGRALSWVATVSAALVLLAVLGAWLYVNQEFSNIRRTPPLCLTGCVGSPPELGSVENFLLVGSDSRSGANSTGALNGLSNGAEDGQNSDTTMLVHLSADQAKVTVVSFPRDLLVDMPSMVVPQTGEVIGGYKAKFNAAYALGEAKGVGPELLVKQVEDLTRLPIDHYLEIDFSGFVSMVNALGGVEICLSQDALDPGIPGVTGGSDFHGTKGVHSIDGLTALAYVRQRDGLPNNDLDRIQRQQRFLASMVRKVKSPSTLLNPFRFNHFLNAVTGAIRLDPGTTRDDLLTLATRLRSLDPAHIAFYTVPISGPGGSATDPHGEYLTIDVPGAHAIFQAVHDDRDPSALVAVAVPPTAAVASAPAAQAPTLIVGTDPAAAQSVTLGSPSAAPAARTPRPQANFTAQSGDCGP